MIQLRRCEFCRHGVMARNETSRHIVCTLIPPRPVMDRKDKVTWLRPTMPLKGWCGQFKMALSKLLLDGGL